MTNVIDQADMRRVLGRFCTGVVVVTAQRGDRPEGFTAQSLTSVSLDPPLVSVCVARTSSTYALVREAGHFCVSVLSEHQDHLSAQFASRLEDRFDGVSHSPSPVNGAPVLHECLAWVDCVIEAEHEAGDHVIVIGRVLDLGSEESGKPLLFFGGAYGGLR
jgi:flavin reductase (DIM6/NTAB) family NADH-FMN oxidoreductase RutF